MRSDQHKHPSPRARYFAAYCSSDNGTWRGSIPLRLLDCFLLVTPVVSDAFGAFLEADSGGAAIFLTCVGIFGAGSDAFKA